MQGTAGLTLAHPFSGHRALSSLGEPGPAQAAPPNPAITGLMFMKQMSTDLGSGQLVWRPTLHHASAVGAWATSLDLSEPITANLGYKPYRE